MNKKKWKKTMSSSPFKSKKITNFLQSAKVTQKKEKRINKTQAPLPLHLRIKVDR